MGMSQHDILYEMILTSSQDLGKMAGKGVRKFTGDLPGWVASDEQKQSLEKMMGQIQEEDMPDESELQKLHEEGGSAMPDKGWMESVKNMIPSMGSGGKSSKSDQQDDNETKKGEASDAGQDNGPSDKDATAKADTNIQDRKKPRKLERKPNDSKDEEIQKLRKERDEYKKKAEDTQADLRGLRDQAAGTSGDTTELVKQIEALQKKYDVSQAEKSSERKGPRKLEAQSDDADAGSTQVTKAKAQPRKLETRS